MKFRWMITMILIAAGVARAADGAPAVCKSIPVREVTVFKDGHAFVMHEGTMPVEADGNVVMDYLPKPLVGTFWPYSADGRVKLQAVTAASKLASIERTALSVRELIEANPGKQVIVTETGEKAQPYEAAIVGVPKISSEELLATSAPGAAEQPARKGEIVMLRTDKGFKSMPISQIRDITFAQEPAPKTTHEEMRNRMTLRLGWPGKPQAEARVGLAYIQEGMRWIPSYRVKLDGAGKARVELEATLINELADMNDVTVRLVVGVPTFKFADTLDPISLQATVASMARGMPRMAQMNISNSIATQFSNAAVAQMAQPEPEPSAPLELGPEIAAGRNEDLFLFTLEHVTLRKGERLVTPVADYELAYSDVYTVEIPFAPSFAMFSNYDTRNARELARLQGRPKAMHKIRLANAGKYPLTTAPALLMNGERVLAQSMMTYTPVGSKVDLAVTQALELPVTQSDAETKRQYNALKIDDAEYMRIDSDGKLSITNRRAESARVEVTRYVFGTLDEVGGDGQKLASNLFDYETFLDEGGLANWLGQMPPWIWDAHINPVMRARWTFDLAPGATRTMTYKWHYFWR